MFNKFSKIIALLFLCSLSARLDAYRWIFSNFTNKDLIIQVELKGSSNPYFYIVKPQKTADFEWGFGNPKIGFCLGKIKYVVASPELLNEGKKLGFINNIIDKIQDNNKALEYFADSSHIQLHEAQVVFEADPVFNAAVKAGNKIGDALASSDLGTKIVGSIAEGISTSNCRSRDYAVVEENGSIKFYTKAN